MCKKYKSSFKYNVAFNLLLILFINLIITTLLFIFNIPISYYHLPLSVIIAFMIMYYIKMKYNYEQNLFSISIFSIFVIHFSSIISKIFIDFNGDSNSYHKVAVDLLANKFNPLYQDATEYGISHNAIWIDHYANANWILEANIAKIYGSVEAGKSINLILILILMLIIFDYLNNKGLSKTRSFFIALITGFTPVTIVQVFTFINDGLFATLLYMVILSLIMISDKEYSEVDRNIIYMQLFMSFCIIGNIKFTGLAYGGLFCAIFYVFWVYELYRDSLTEESISKIIKLTIYFIIMLLTTIVLIGSSSYMNNLIDHRNLLYPLFGKDKIDIITLNQPVSFANISGIKKLFLSIFSRVEIRGSVGQWNEPILKIPFTISKEELSFLNESQIRISGYGVWFSGIFIISLLVIITFMYRKKVIIPKSINLVMIISIVISLLIGDSWWARYSPQIYIFVIIAITIYSFDSYKVSNIKILIKEIIIFSLILINTGLFILNSNQLYMTQLLKEELNNTSKVDGKLQVLEDSFEGVYTIFKDYNINYELTDKLKDQEDVKSVGIFRFIELENDKK